MSKHKAVDARIDWSRGGGKAPQLWVLANIDEDWRADFRLCVQGDRLVVAEVRLYPRITEDGKQADFGISSGWNDGDTAGAPWSAGEAAGIEAKAPEGGVTARLLRQVPVHIHETLATFADAVGRGPRIPDAYLAAGPLTAAKLNGEKKPRQGRPPVPDARLLKVATIYADAVASGKPVQAVAAELKMSGSKARDLVHRARQRGFLTQATPGRASGQLTPKATALLRKIKKGSKSKRRR